MVYDGSLPHITEPPGLIFDTGVLRVSIETSHAFNTESPSVLLERIPTIKMTACRTSVLPDQLKD